MKNPNQKATVQKTPGSNGVKVGLNPSATVTKKPGGRVGGTNSSAKVHPC